MAVVLEDHGQSQKYTPSVRVCILRTVAEDRRHHSGRISIYACDKTGTPGNSADIVLLSSACP